MLSGLSLSFLYQRDKEAFWLWIAGKIPLESLYHNARRLSLRESAERPTALCAGRLVIIACSGVFFKDF